MTLEQFEIGLSNIVGRPSSLRPFVCEGSPFDCEVFIVGYNPATAMDGDWWRFWKAGYGFEKDRCWNEYIDQRGGEISKTRKCIEAIVADLNPVRVLEANIDARPSKQKSEYPTPVTTPFDFLLAALTPKVVIAHGTDAVAHLQGWATSGKLISCKHFIYVGHERRASIVADAKAALAS
jgi:hypothetical protein